MWIDIVYSVRSFIGLTDSYNKWADLLNKHNLYNCINLYDNIVVF